MGSEDADREYPRLGVADPDQISTCEDVHGWTPQKRGVNNTVATLQISTPLRGIRKFVTRRSTEIVDRVFSSLQGPMTWPDLGDLEVGFGSPASLSLVPTISS